MQNCQISYVNLTSSFINSTSNATAYVGGLVGNMYGGGFISNCYSLNSAVYSWGCRGKAGGFLGCAKGISMDSLFNLGFPANPTRYLLHTISASPGGIIGSATSLSISIAGVQSGVIFSANCRVLFFIFTFFLSQFEKGTGGGVSGAMANSNMSQVYVHSDVTVNCTSSKYQKKKKRNRKKAFLK